MAKQVDHKPGGAQNSIDRAKSAGFQSTCYAVIVVVTLLGLFILLDMPIIRSDGLAYYMWLESLVVDHDLDLGNQMAHYQPLVKYQVFYYAPTGQYASSFPFGAAFLWGPFYWLSLGLDKLPIVHVNDAYFLQLQGDILVHSLGVTMGTNFYALLTALMVFYLARRWVSDPIAAFVVLATFLGTSQLYYSTIEPAMTHALAAFVLTLLIYLYITRGSQTTWWFAMGVVLGLATAIRWQAALYGLPLGVLLLATKRIRPFVFFSLGFMVLAWSVPYSWYLMFSRPFVVPAGLQDPRFSLLVPKYVLEILFSLRRGLFMWSPIALLGVCGLYPLFQKNRRLSLIMIAMFVIQTIMNASVQDWWAGWSFGMRRMTDLYPVFALGLAALLGWARDRSFVVQPHLTRVLRWGGPMTLILGVSGICVAYTLLLMVTYAANMIHPDMGTVTDALVYWLTAPNPRVVFGTMIRHYGLLAWLGPH